MCYVFIAYKHNLWGDHPWLGGTTYGAVDSPGGPSTAAIVGPGGGATMATKYAIDGPGRSIFGGTTGGVTGFIFVFDQPAVV